MRSGGLARGLATLAVLALVMASLPVRAQGQPYIATIAFEANGVTLRAGEPVYVTLTLNGAARQAQRYTDSTVQVEAVRTDAIDLLITGQEHFTGPPQARHLAASFVIDFDEPELAPLDADAKALRPEIDTPPSPQELAQLVFDALPKKTYERGFDLASQAVRAGAGDCTEHAVVMAALARAQGLPSRVVFGALVLASAEAKAAFGHAWNEVYVDGQWRIVDATLPEAEGEPLVYIPLSTFDNEGPGYGLGLFDSFQSLPSRITLRRPPER